MSLIPTDELTLFIMKSKGIFWSNEKHFIFFFKKFINALSNIEKLVVLVRMKCGHNLVAIKMGIEMRMRMANC